MGKRIDLNCDLGESFGIYEIGQDERVLDYVTSANIACGYHAGDHNVMAQTVKMAKQKNVGIGAHPGLPDLSGFGRREMAVDPIDVYHFTIYQIGALQAFCNVNQNDMQHVKPHGALYNMSARDPRIAQALARAVQEVNPDLILFGLAGSELIKAGRYYGLQTASEVFADRTYQDDGSLTPRTCQDALIHDVELAEEQVVRMVKDGFVRSVNGKEIAIQADTICTHGDGPKALAFVKRLKNRLSSEGLTIERVGG